MPLARIITRSETCSRQLAMDLLSRGYAVEIVTPDAIPDNFADLELRVEEDSGNRLSASVEAHKGGRSASLDFVHHLRAPLADFARRAPQPAEVIYLSEEPVSLTAGPSAEKVQLPAKIPQPARTDPRGTDSFTREAAPLPSLPKLQPSPWGGTDAVEPGQFAKQDDTVDGTSAAARTVVASTPAPLAMVSPGPVPRRKRFAAWQWRVTIAATGMASLAVALALGVRRYEENSTPVPEAVRTEKMAVPSFESYSLAATSENDRQRDPADVRGDSDHLPKNSTDTTAEDAVVRASMVDKTGRSRQRDGLIARDTVTYLDASRRPAPKAQPAKGVAANTVTYLSKPIPKPAK